MFENLLEKKKVQRLDHYQKNEKTEWTRGPGIRTREETGNGNQVQVLGLQTRVIYSFNYFFKGRSNITYVKTFNKNEKELNLLGGGGLGTEGDWSYVSKTWHIKILLLVNSTILSLSTSPCSFFCDSYICHVYLNLVDSFVLLWQLHMSCLPNPSQFICLLRQLHMPCLPTSHFICSFVTVTYAMFTRP